MRKSIYFLLAILLVLVNIVNGQIPQFQVCEECDNEPLEDGSIVVPDDEFIYRARQNYIARDIVSDFGPRRLGERSATEFRYDWHAGVDLSSWEFGSSDEDRGDAIVAIEGGSTRIEASGGYKYLIVNGTRNFGYGHIFHSSGIPQRSGAFVLTLMDNSNNLYAIVNTQTGDAFGDEEGTVTLNLDDGRTIIYDVIGYPSNVVKG